MLRQSISSRRLGRSVTCLLLLACYIGLAEAQGSGAAPSSFHVTHVLGLEGLADNVNGTLTIDARALRFHPNDGKDAQIDVSSIEDVALGVQDKEVGGTPLAIGRVAAPFGGGRVIGLFAHKKYDIVTVEYRDSNGGFHGAIFQLHKGEGQVLKSELHADGSGQAVKDQRTNIQNKGNHNESK